MLNILIIDDEPDILEILKSSFELIGECKIDVADNGLDGLVKASANQYQLICTDFEMPVMNGGDFLKGLRESSVENAEVPVLFITGLKPKLSADQKQWENVYFLEKPLDDERLKFYYLLAVKKFQKAG